MAVQPARCVKCGQIRTAGSYHSSQNSNSRVKTVLTVEQFREEIQVVNIDNDVELEVAFDLTELQQLYDKSREYGNPKLIRRDHQEKATEEKDIERKATERMVQDFVQNVTGYYFIWDKNRDGPTYCMSSYFRCAQSDCGKARGKITHQKSKPEDQNVKKRNTPKKQRYPCQGYLLFKIYHSSQYDRHQIGYLKFGHTTPHPRYIEVGLTDAQKIFIDKNIKHMTVDTIFRAIEISDELQPAANSSLSESSVRRYWAQKWHLARRMDHLSSPPVSNLIQSNRIDSRPIESCYIGSRSNGSNQLQDSLSDLDITSSLLASSTSATKNLKRLREQIEIHKKYLTLMEATEKRGRIDKEQLDRFDKIVKPMESVLEEVKRYHKRSKKSKEQQRMDENEYVFL